ncbi:hypothetical protein tb265_08150 [Gemmatimonadetes bacterium T265]|nr:hypothetical protein tb265_08150 [Gemmatimonadetes bacterium T265]
MTTAPHAPAAADAAETDASVSAAEQTRAAALGAVLFRNRGWLPVPFVAVPLLAPSQLGPGQYVRAWVVGALLVVFGEAFRLAGVAAAGTVTRRRSRTVQRLVTYGVFAWMRNPLYVGNFFAWLGVVVASGVLWFLPVAALLFAVEYTLIVRYEEGVLESIFGGEYLAYKARTPRWLPRPPRAPEHGPHAWGEALRSEVSTLLQYVGLAAALGVKHWVTTR